MIKSSHRAKTIKLPSIGNGMQSEGNSPLLINRLHVKLINQKTIEILYKAKEVTNRGKENIDTSLGQEKEGIISCEDF